MNKLFSSEPFHQIKIEKPWGYELVLTPIDRPFTGKILHIEAGKRTSLQYHDKKEETQILMSGRCTRIFEDESGKLVEQEMQEGLSYTNVPNQKHRLAAKEDCNIFEISTKEKGKTFRLEDDYGRSDETEDTRKLPNRGWKN